MNIVCGIWIFFGYNHFSSCFDTRAPGPFCYALRTSRNRFWNADGHEPILYFAHTKEGDRPLSLGEWQSILGMDEGSICAPPDGFTVMPDARIVYQ